MFKPMPITVYIPVEALSEQQFDANVYVVNTLRKHGIPVIGPVGVISVETGRLTMSMEYDGELSLVYRWIGTPLPQHLRKHYFTLDKPLADILEKENDL